MIVCSHVMLLGLLIFFFFKHHEANSSGVRFRVCQLINKLLGSMPENAMIDDDLFDKINEAMLIRLKDKVPNVRTQAVHALSRLQDPKDDECSVINGECSFLNLFSFVDFVNFLVVECFVMNYIY